MGLYLKDFLSKAFYQNCTVIQPIQMMNNINIPDIEKVTFITKMPYF